MSRTVDRPLVGIIGGGQLGSMMADAARVLGFRVRVLDPYSHCPARGASDELVTAAFDDVEAAVRLARDCVAVTVDLEKVGLDALRAAAQHAPTRPSADVLEIVQDRIRQKEWLDSIEAPIAPWRAVRTSDELDAALEALGDGVFVKAAFGGYDGRGQVRVRSTDDVEDARTLVGHAPCVVEQPVDFVVELSVQVARRPSGETAVFAPALNHHANQILAWTLLPAPLPEAVADAAETLATRVADALGVEGLLTVEMFLLADGSLVVNELAPRPHNSFHTTLVAGPTSQFEQAMRAVTDLPLAEPEVWRPTVVANLLGDLWMGDEPFDIAAALQVPGVKVHLYGKTEARAARKMGHLTATGDTAAEALERADAALHALGGALAEPTLPDLSALSR